MERVRVGRTERSALPCSSQRYVSPVQTGKPASSARDMQMHRTAAHFTHSTQHTARNLYRLTWQTEQKLHFVTQQASLATQRQQQHQRSLSPNLKGYKIWIDLPDTETNHSLCVSGLLVPSSLLRATDNVTAWCDFPGVDNLPSSYQAAFLPFAAPTASQAGCTVKSTDSQQGHVSVFWWE